MVKKKISDQKLLNKIYLWIISFPKEGYVLGLGANHKKTLKAIYCTYGAENRLY